MELSRYNPLVILCYFLSNILITMITKNPIFIMISFASVVLYSFTVKTPKGIVRTIIVIIIILVLSSITNPLFNPLGDTIVFSLGKKNFSFEALAYGFIAALMLIAIVLWFRNYNLLMSSDKFLYLFARYLPKLALIISMTLKAIPDVLKKAKDLDDAQKVIGIYAKKGIVKKLKNKFLILGSLFSYQIENSMQTATAMKARGYGLKGKTYYSKYSFKLYDIVLLVLIISMTVLIIALSSNILINYNYYPKIAPIATDLRSLISYGLFFINANLATFIHLKEKVKWHYLKSKIYPSLTH